MKKRIFTLGVLMISFLVSGCAGEDSSAPYFTVGGIVSGLTGTLVLQNNGGDDLTVTANGPFTLSKGKAPGSSYAVTVRVNPADQTCIVSNGTGTILISSITNVSVDCVKRGGLDLSFNSPNGFVVHDSAAGGAGDDFGNAVAVDPQGRILSAGSSTNSAGNMDMALWRFNDDGTLDTTFNSPNGFVVHDSVAGGVGDDSAHAIAIDADGNILVTGTSKSTAGNMDMVVWRFKDNGTLDTTFANNGIATWPTGTGDQSGNAITIDSQNRILVTGSSKNSAGTTDMVIWRFNANGTRDTGFNKSGIVANNNAALGNGDDTGKAIAVDSTGRILVAGSSRNSAGNMDMVVWRYKNDGTLDTTFNADGIFANADAAGGTGDDWGNAIAIDSQDRIVVAGSSKNTSDTDMVIWRLKADGSALDTTFNGTGIVINNGAAGSNGDDSGSGIAIDSEKRILVTGSSKNSAGNTDMIVWRYKDDGTIDITFAADGIAVHNGAAGGDDSGRAVAVDSQNRILVTGSSQNTAGNSDMVIWRLSP